MKKIYYFLHPVALVLLLSGIAIAGEQQPPAAVPTFTPWGALVTAAVLGISGAYVLLKRRK